MRKVIVAFEAANFSEGAMRFVSAMNKAEQVTVTGIFLPAALYTTFGNHADALSTGVLLPVTDDVETSEINKSVLKFREYCASHHLRHRVIKKFDDFGLPELKQQSRYADLVVLGSEYFFKVPESDKLSDYLKTSLHDAECPVVVVPESFSQPQINILTCDGTASSARAIKNFTYLFPEMSRDHTVVAMFEPNNTRHKDQDVKIKELVSAHFPDHQFVHSGADSSRYFSDWSVDNRPAIVVCGAFGRSVISILFRKSFIADVLMNQKLPVFISHR